MNLISLADRLHKTIEEVEQISVTEFFEWLAYFKIISESDNGGNTSTTNPNKGFR